MVYEDEDMLMLSGIQHYMFCPRQWALIHVEQQWNENRLTTEGNILHQNVDNPFYRQNNNGVATLRSMHVASKELGLYGITDAVELHPSSDGILIEGTNVPVLLYPVEYKHGHVKTDERDEVQLAAQRICLEEMYDTNIPEGSLLYNETKRRTVVRIDEHLRTLTQRLAGEMHKIFSEGITPLAELKSCCKKCSLIDLCMPQLSLQTKVKAYLKNNLYEKDA